MRESTRTRVGSRVRESRERRAGGGFGAVRRDLGPRGRQSRGCAGRSTPGAKQTWSRTHQEFGVIFAVPGFSCPLGLSLSHCGNGHRPPCVPASHPLHFSGVRCSSPAAKRNNIPAYDVGQLVGFRPLRLLPLKLILRQRAAYQDNTKITRPLI